MSEIDAVELDSGAIENFSCETELELEKDISSKPKWNGHEISENTVLEESLIPIFQESVDREIEQETKDICEHDRGPLLRLLWEEEALKNSIDGHKKALHNPNYSKFGTPEATLVEYNAGVDEAKKKLDEKKDKKSIGNRQAREKEKKIEAADKNHKAAKRDRDEVKKYVDDLNAVIHLLEKRLEKNREEQANLIEKLPKEEENGSHGFYESLHLDGTHLLLPSFLTSPHKFTGSTEKTDYKEDKWNGGDSNKPERVKVFCIFEDCHGNKNKIHVDDLPNEKLASEMMSLHKQAFDNYTNAYNEFYIAQQGLIDLGVPANAIPKAPDIHMAYYDVNKTAGRGAATVHRNGEEIFKERGKHKGNTAVEIVKMNVAADNLAYKKAVEEYKQVLEDKFPNYEQQIEIKRLKNIVSSLRTALVEANKNIDKAQKKVDEELAKIQEICEDKKAKAKAIYKAKESLDIARADLEKLINTRDKIQDNLQDKLNEVDKKIAKLEGKAPTPENSEGSVEKEEVQHL